MQKTEAKEDARTHRAYSSRWRRGHSRAQAQCWFDALGEVERLLAQWKIEGKPSQ